MLTPPHCSISSRGRAAVAAAELLVLPTRVQGDGAVAGLCAAFRLLGRLRGLDVAIVGRGGGSKEDLGAFNNERVARAVAAAPVPVISAVGHETDVTLCDLVADFRASTPSAAAAAATPIARKCWTMWRNSGPVSAAGWPRAWTGARSGSSAPWID